MMKKQIMAILAALALFFSCTTEENPITRPDEDVTIVDVAFSDIQVSMLPEEGPQLMTRATAAEAEIGRIALKVYDAGGVEVQSVIKNKVNGDDMEHVSFPLHAGTYTFVAVAHRASDNDKPAADIESASKATITNRTLPVLTYTKKMEVTVSGNDRQDVEIDFGKKVTSSLILYITDATPGEVTKMKVTINPGHEVAKSPYELDPATGLALGEKTYVTDVTFEKLKTNTFSNVNIQLNVFLASEEEDMDVNIEMMDSNDKVLYERTLSGVPFKQHRTLKAKGTFFTVSTKDTFVFDNLNESMNIPLNPNEQ